MTKLIKGACEIGLGFLRLGFYYEIDIFIIEPENEMSMGLSKH
jgi:hypothetical protein